MACVLALQAKEVARESSVEGSWQPTRGTKETEKDMEGRMVSGRVLLPFHRIVERCALHQASIADEREKLAALLASK